MNSFPLYACLSDPTWTCLQSPRVAFPLIMLGVLVAVGFAVRRANVRAFRRVRTLAIRLSAVLLAVMGTLITYFLLFDPETVNGTETSAAAQSLWVAAVAGLGGTVAMIAATLSLSLGGWLAKKPRKASGAGKLKISDTEGLVIAIDGPAASGKGTLAKRIGDALDLPFLDTGLLYRAVARDVSRAGSVLSDNEAAVRAAKAIDPTTLGDPALRGPTAGDAASQVARIADVRAALLDFQRAFAGQPRGAVLDGRDIATVVCPDARVKLYITASAEERARRRHREHQMRGDDISYDVILGDIRARDARDSGRDIAPMGPASDAVVLDTTGLDADAVFAAAMAIVRGKIR